MGRAAKFTKPDLDSIGVLAQAAADYRWPGGPKGETAKKAEVWYDRFLELCYDNPGTSPPLLTKQADQLWHTHITFTQQYSNYTNSILGYYLDHIPDVPRRAPSKEELEVARKLYARWVGRRRGGVGGRTALIQAITPDMIVQCKP